jgi:hypothetical protein
MTVRFCWLCDEPVSAWPDSMLSSTHYETGRAVFFCSDEHWHAYRQLAEL